MGGMGLVVRKGSGGQLGHREAGHLHALHRDGPTTRTGTQGEGPPRWWGAWSKAAAAAATAAAAAGVNRLVSLARRGRWEGSGAGGTL